LTYHLRRIPKKGEQTNIQGVMFKVVQSDEKRVQKIMVEKAFS
jgi:CBS domain containing-hemolysin-like protein